MYITARYGIVCGLSLLYFTRHRRWNHDVRMSETEKEQGAAELRRASAPTQMSRNCLAKFAIQGKQMPIVRSGLNEVGP
jgi:hypothetical protein